MKYCALLCGLLVSAVTNACELPEWQARYVITKYGMTLARVNMTLHTNNGTAQYRTQTETAGIVAALSDEALTDTSDLKQAEDKSWYLEKYSQQRVKDPQRNQQFTLQHIGDEYIATGDSGKECFNLQLPAQAWDRSSVQLALTCDLLTSKKPRAVYDYTVIDKGEISTYRFEYRGKFNIRIADKQFNTLKFERVSGDRSTIFWLDPSLNYMLVRMEQYKDKSLHLRMNLDIPVAEIP